MSDFSSQLETIKHLRSTKREINEKCLRCPSCGLIPVIPNGLQYTCALCKFSFLILGSEDISGFRTLEEGVECMFEIQGTLKVPRSRPGVLSLLRVGANEIVIEPESG